jgi:tRNA (guanine37-N1)-methyltransferase
MHVDLISLFPEYFEGPLGLSIMGRATRSGLLSVDVHQLREYSRDHHRRVDDRALGGGPGMVIMAQPLKDALQSLRKEGSHVVYMSPQGKTLNAQIARKLASYSHLIFVCGHYEGIDQRIIDREIDEEISIGDYVLTSGCLPALVTLDTLIRYIPGVLGDAQSSEQDSFEGPLLDHPHYTLPREFEGAQVPEVLLGGNHQDVDRWRQGQQMEATWTKRADLLAHWWKSEGQKEGEKSTSFKGIILPTRYLNLYAKRLGKQMRLPWISKSDTMGALLLEHAEIILWQAGQADEISCHVHFQIDLPEEGFKLCVPAAREWQKACGEVTVEWHQSQILIQDPLGWRLVLRNREEKKD